VKNKYFLSGSKGNCLEMRRTEYFLSGSKGNCLENEENRILPERIQGNCLEDCRETRLNSFILMVDIWKILHSV